MYHSIPELVRVQSNDQIMAFQATVLDRLSDDLLQHILDLAMARDSPCYIDDPRPGLDRTTFIKRQHPPKLESSTGAKDPYYTGCKKGTPQHHRALQPAHRMDWVIVSELNILLDSLSLSQIAREMLWSGQTLFRQRKSCRLSGSVPPLRR